jgi:enoyl-CoA hydratase/carnithine racemase
LVVGLFQAEAVLFIFLCSWGESLALEIIASSEDYDADTAQRYGWINRAITDKELDDFVDRFARRIASFDKKVLTEAKRLVNRSSPMPDDARLVAAEETFTRMLSWPETRARIAELIERGLQKPATLNSGLASTLAMNNS